MSERVGRVAAVLGAAVMAVTPAVAAMSTSSVASAAETQTVASSAVTVDGTGAFSGVKLTVDQTKDLVNQAVTVSWSGAGPSLVTASGSVLGNYLQLMQCWAEPGQQPTREQCQYGGFVDVADGAGNIASRQMTQPVKDPAETVYVQAPGEFTLKFVNFKAVDGTVETTRRSQFFDGATTNEIPIGRTSQDGQGQAYFEMQTGLEAPGLGCGQSIGGRTPDCFLVVVPRGLTEVDGSTVGATLNDSLTTSPLSTSNWANRIVVPLSFRQIGGACTFGRTETPTFGSDFVTEAITSWQPVLCGLGPRNYGFSSLSDDTTRQQLASDEPGLAFVNSSVKGVDGVVYAPVSVSAMSFVANIDRQMPILNPAGKPISPDQVPVEIRDKVGSRFDSIKLTPRLVAKLLTQSYTFDIANGTAKNIAKNPFDISRDPDFLAVNPDFKPQGYTILIGNGLARMFVTAGLSDAADLMWRYVLSDEDARNFLAGKPDPWGMVLNEKYKGLTLPTNSFPRADLGCALPSNALPGFTLELCTLDVFPYANSFNAAARQVSRGEANRRDVPRLSDVQSYGLSPNQVLGQRSLMGLTDSASANRYRQVQVSLRNAAGEFVAPDEKGMTAALAAMGPDAAGVLTPNLGSTSKAAYPLTVVTYAATVPGKLTAEQRGDYARLLEYAAVRGQERGTAAGQLPDGYIPLTPTLSAQAVKAAGSIQDYVPPAPSPTPTDTTTPEPTDTSVAFPTTEPDTTTDEVPGTGETSPTPTPSSPVPTATPTTVPVAAVGVTPADPASASRLALLAAFLLGMVALLLRAVLPWFTGRRA